MEAPSRESIQYPDGQLYVNLRGYDPVGEVVRRVTERRAHSRNCRDAMGR